MDAVLDNEVLYRCIKQHEGYAVQAADGTVVFSSSAFMDRSKRPSVNRAALCGSDPSRTKVAASDGVTSVIAGDRMLKRLAILATQCQWELPPLA